MIVYHCTTHGTEADWFTKMFTDPWLRSRHQNSDLGFYHTGTLPDVNPYQNNAWDATIIPDNNVASAMYISYQDFLDMPDEEDRAFFVIRHPKEIVVSIFERWTNGLISDDMYMENLYTRYKDLDHIELKKRIIDICFDNGLFQTHIDWYKNITSDQRFLVVFFEDLIGEKRAKTVSKIFTHCGFDMSEALTDTYIKNFSTQRIVSEVPNMYKKSDWTKKWNSLLDDYWEEKAKESDIKELPYSYL